MTLNIDLRDPQVQQVLGLGNGGLATGKRPVVQLAGDAPDPTGLTDYRGAMSTTRLIDGRSEVVVLYKDLLMTVDLYFVPGEPLRAHLYCPRCQKHSTVRGDYKAIDFDPAAANPAFSDIMATGAIPPELARIAAVGRLSIETFECPWEIGDDKHVPGVVRTGASMCRLRIAIDNNRAKDA